MRADVYPSHPTLYPDVNAVLQLLLSRVSAVLEGELVGVYLYGSLSWGDFDPESSDIDFLVVTTGELPASQLEALKAMHADIAASGLQWAKRLEGSYIPQAALRRYDSANARHPSIGSDWEFGIGQHGSNWVLERHIVREQGVILWGPPPDTLIDPMTPDELRKATVACLRDFWAQQLDGPEWLRPRKYQAFAILTMCRALYTVERGEVASKPVAAAWAQAFLGPPWTPLIQRALLWRHDPQPDDMTEMLSFIRSTLERCQDSKLS